MGEAASKENEPERGQLNRRAAAIPDLALAVTVTPVRGEPHHGVVGRGDERRGDRDLVLGAGRDVKADLSDDGHVEVVHQGHLQALAALAEVVVVEGLCRRQFNVNRS